MRFFLERGLCFFCFGVVGAFLHIMGTSLWVGLQSPPLRSAANGRYWCQACPGLASGFWMDDVSDESDVFISLRLMPPAFAGLEIASSMARSTTKSSSSNNSTILSIASSMARSTTKSNSNSSNNQQQQ